MIKFVVFHAGVSSLPTYKPLMVVAKEALEYTNPGARYIVLTDKETAPHLDREFEVDVLAPSGEPLMRQFVMAQLAYERKQHSGAVVLAGSDCVANGDLDKAARFDFGITYRYRGKSLINNIAYIRDHDRAVWFLKRALDVMRPDLYDFWGDQQSWEDALPPPERWKLCQQNDREDGLRVAHPGGVEVYLYPCRTHNYFTKRSGSFSPTAKRAYLVHFKGTRKLNMVESVRWNILQCGGDPPDWNKLRERMGNTVLPMEEKRRGR